VQLFRNPEQARQIGSAGQRFAVENFSFERLIREVDELYTELLDRAKHKR
jgi:glycosyltransferase involved in cell wall biosynthesis